MKLTTRRRQVQPASDGALLFISFIIDQTDAALPHFAVRGTFPAEETISYHFLVWVFFFRDVDAQPDKQAQESVTARYIRRSAAA